MQKNNIKNLYAIGHAKWYDPFKKIWNRLVADKAEKEFTAFLKNNLNKNTGILELGCGTALNLEKIFTLNLKFKKYLGLDFSPDMIEIAENKFKKFSLNLSSRASKSESRDLQIKFQQQDITELNNINEKFDIIICTWVLSHLKEQSQLVNEAQKLLSPQGKFFLIFFSKPKWFINFWLHPIAKYTLKSIPVSEMEVDKFTNIKTKHKFAGDITTVVVIHK